MIHSSQLEWVTTSRNVVNVGECCQWDAVIVLGVWLIGRLRQISTKIQRHYVKSLKHHLIFPTEKTHIGSSDQQLPTVALLVHERS